MMPWSVEAYDEEPPSRLVETEFLMLSGDPQVGRSTILPSGSRPAPSGTAMLVRCGSQASPVAPVKSRTRSCLTPYRGRYTTFPRITGGAQLEDSLGAGDSLGTADSLGVGDSLGTADSLGVGDSVTVGDADGSGVSGTRIVSPASGPLPPLSESSATRRRASSASPAAQKN